MDGPELIARTLSQPDNVVSKTYGNPWQYNSQSDHHSKTMCFALLIDLLKHCDVLRDHARRGVIGFGINHKMTDFAHNKEKDLDLVICTPQSKADPGLQLPDFAERYHLDLDEEAWQFIRGFPAFRSVPVGYVQIALEAKAAMTAHVRALPRLHDELNSSHNIVHGHHGTSIAAGLVLVNLSDTFISPNMNKFSLAEREPVVSKHKQPKDAVRTIETVKGLPRRADTSQSGFDALSIIVVRCKNDGSTVELVDEPPAPGRDDIFSYTSIVNRICSLYRSRFPLQ